MLRFVKTPGFKVLIIVLAALFIGSGFAVASRSGSSPVTSFTSIVFAPASRLAGGVSSVLARLPISFRSSSALEKQVKDLQAQVDSLKEQLVDYEQVVHQNEIYEEFLELKEEHSDYSFKEAAVIGKDAAGRNETLILNRGSASGIEVNDPVIYGKYLVGVVTAVTPAQCTVTTLLSPEINVSAYEVRTKELSFVTSTIEHAEKGQCCIPTLSARTAVTAGGMVCTSGVGGIYPRDLIIGTIDDIIDSTIDISAEAIITPGVDFGQLTDVFIITDFEK